LSEPACPRCSDPLDVLAVARGRLWRCSSCDGRLVDEEGLGAITSPESVVAIRGTFHKPSGVPCPLCEAELAGGVLAGVAIDGCPSCHATWFDAEELEPFRQGLDSHTERTIRTPEGRVLAWDPSHPLWWVRDLFGF